MSPQALAIIATAATTNAACAVVGCYLVLRRMSMMGDALSHAVLPGLALAFIVSGTIFGGEHAYAIGPLLVGAVAAGLLTSLLTQTLHHYAGVPADASMGVVFTSLFALGVIIIKKGIQGVHFDVSCVYQGNIEHAPFDTWVVLGYEAPRALVVTGGVLVLNAIVIVTLWKELKLSSFDPALATTMGYSAGLMHYLLMSLVAITATASFEAVGSILVVAMLIIPPAAAHLVADRLAPMMLIAVVIGVLSAILGYVFSVWFNTNVAGMMTVAAAAIYGAAVLFAPNYGLLSTAWRNTQVALRVVREDLLAMLYRVEELSANRRLAATEARTAVGGGLLARWALSSLLRSRRLATDASERLELTPAGREDARQLVRSHRLWETYLHEYLGVPLDHVHEPAHRVEHFISEDMRDELQQQVGAAADPHGREIPE
jgi:manganese/zinc/iron transport system permease protein